MRRCTSSLPKPSPTRRKRPGRIRSAALAAAPCLLAALAVQGPARAQPQAGEPPLSCRIGANIEDLYDIDIARDTFGAVLWVWSLCPPSELAPLATVAYPTATTLALGELTSIDPGVPGRYQYRRVQGVFRHDWDMGRYPFDRHRVVIPFDETHDGASALLFETDVANSFLTPDILSRRHEWLVSDFAIEANVSEEAQTYGLPHLEVARYARAEVAFTLTRAGVLTFLKLTSGAFATGFIALLSFCYDSRHSDGLPRRLGLLVGALFAVLVNMRTADTVIGDAGRLTLVTNVHLAVMALIVALAAVALRDWWRHERALPLAYPNWPELAAASGLFALVTGGLVAYAAWSG